MVAIPTIIQLYNGILSDLETRYNISIPLIGKNFLRILAMVQAAKLKLFYLALANIQKQIAPDTADSEIVGGTLERFGRIKINRDPFQAVSAQYVATVTGTIGGAIPAQTTYLSNNDSQNPGILYILDTAYTLASTTDHITLRALTSGLNGQLNIGDGLTATAPIALVDSLALVSSVAVAPLAAETTAQYRSIVLSSYREEPQGGAGTDYRQWAFDAQGVANTYPYVKSGVDDEINLFVEAIVADSTDGKGTPSALLLSQVYDVVNFNPDDTLPINQRGRRPLGTFEVNCLPVTIKTIDIVVTGFVGITTALQTQILNAVTAKINTTRPFVASSDILANKNDILDVNRIISIILSVYPGAVFTSVTLKVNSVSMSTYTFTNGDIPFLNSITYA